MSDISAGMRAQVREALLPTLVSKVVSLEADGGRTMKDLWRLYDGAQVESVLMRYPQRTTLCVSSQAGCGMACPFCATGQMVPRRCAGGWPDDSVEHRVHGDGGAVGQLQDGDRCVASPH